MEDKSRTLYCGNLSEKVTEDLLYELFLQAGPLENVSMPKDKEGRPRKFAFITFKHAVSVPYTVALMNGISLFGKSLSLSVRTGSNAEHNPYLEKLMQYRSSFNHQALVGNTNYNSQRDPYDERSHVYDPRRYDTRGEGPRTDYSNSWNPYSGQISQYSISPSGMLGAPPLPNQVRFPQNTMTQISYPTRYSSQTPWSRSHR